MTTPAPAEAHTPGPWIVCAARRNGVPVEFTIYAPKHDPIGKLYGNGFDTEANAHLIAAAPAMYEALKAIAEGCSFPADDVQRACRDRARLALASARPTGA